MRDATVYGHLQGLLKYIQQIEQSVRLGLTGEVVRAESLQRLLIKKGIITEQELTEEIGNIIKEVNKPKSEEQAPKPELTVPTPEQVQAVEKSVEEPKK
jgi:hypothetical protein